MAKYIFVIGIVNNMFWNVYNLILIYGLICIIYMLKDPKYVGMFEKKNTHAFKGYIITVLY